MGESGGFNGGDNIDDLPGGSFSRLLLSTDDINSNSVLNKSSNNNINSNSNFLIFSHAHQPSPMFSSNTPNMLCFGDFVSETTPFSSSLVTAYTDSSVSSCGKSIPFLNNKRSGSGQETGFGFGLGSGNGQSNGKKSKPEVGPTMSSKAAATTTSGGYAKVRRERLGERITVLHQLVCPYGKTDTASVLHEAIGYVRFLQDQVKVLSTPYLQRSFSSTSPHDHNPLSLNENSASNTKAYDSTSSLRSRGLCLVPVESIVDTENSNGADYWSSATS